ncbi:hypothetical protein B0H19DRAFT_1275156 [Mycena capillaripes]|nr:hypothetical protein B0H19DRAFT_1275156 [Mycena capillaripes]
MLADMTRASHLFCAYVDLHLVTGATWNPGYHSVFSFASQHLQHLRIRCLRCVSPLLSFLLLPPFPLPSFLLALPPLPSWRTHFSVAPAAAFTGVYTSAYSPAPPDHAALIEEEEFRSRFCFLRCEYTSALVRTAAVYAPPAYISPNSFFLYASPKYPSVVLYLYSCPASSTTSRSSTTPPYPPLPPLLLDRAHPPRSADERAPARSRVHAHPASLNLHRRLFDDVKQTTCTAAKNAHPRLEGVRNVVDHGARKGGTPVAGTPVATREKKKKGSKNGNVPSASRAYVGPQTLAGGALRKPCAHGCPAQNGILVLVLYASTPLPLDALRMHGGAALVLDTRGRFDILERSHQSPPLVHTSTAMPPLQHLGLPLPCLSIGILSTPSSASLLRHARPPYSSSLSHQSNTLQASGGWGWVTVGADDQRT